MGRSLSQMAEDLERAADRLERNERGLRAHVAARTAEYAQRLSSGPFSSNALARMDHPYARRHGRPLLDPGIINRQSGLFVRSWRVDRIETPTGVAYVVRNTAPYASYLEHGTRYAIARPLDDRLRYFAEREYQRLAPSLLAVRL